MKTDNELEQLLRKAPAPPPPFGLEQRLIQQASRPKARNTWNWFSLFQERTWAPALALVVILAGLLTALGFQQNTLRNLERAQREAAAQLASAAVQSQSPPPAAYAAPEVELQELRKQSVELQNLRAELAEIERLLAQQQPLAQENAALRAELSSLTRNNPELSPDLQAALAAARKKAERIQCVNNLKNVGLAARIWATDHPDKNGLPGDFLTITNELSTPRVLICPSDPSRSRNFDSWQQFKTVGSSYEILSPGIPETIPAAAYVRCPIHNNVCRADGSVLQLRPDQQLIQRDGHWEIGE